MVSLMRKGRSPDDIIIIVCNFTPSTHSNYQIGVPKAGFWRELLNSDATDYGGSGKGNMGGVEAAPIPLHGRPYSMTFTLPPLATVFFRHAEAKL